MLETCFVNDGGVVVVARSDCSLQLWDVATGTPLHVVEGHSEDILSISCSPCGHMFATTSIDGTARFWDVQRGVSIRKLDIGIDEELGYRPPIMAVHWASGSKCIVTACEG